MIRVLHTEWLIGWVCVLLAVGPQMASAQPFESGVSIPKPGSVPAFPVEIDFQVPPDYVVKDTVDLSKWFPPPGNQRRQASCTTWALCYAAMGYFWNRADERTYTPLDTADPTTTYSPAFLFNLIKQGSNGSCGNGVSFASIAQLATENGTCTWEQMPYDTALTSCMAEVPLTVMGTAASSLRPQIVDIEKTNIIQWKYHLDMGHPIIVEIVPDSLFTQGGYATHGDSMLHWDSGKNGYLEYGHAVVCTGYCGDSLFTFINSFGTRWGGHGYFTATWEILTDRCTDAHALVNDPADLMALEPMLHQLKDSIAGPVVKERIKLGQVHVINRTAIRMDAIDKGRKSILLRLFDPAKQTLQNTLQMRSGQTYTIYESGKRTNYVYTRPALVGRAFLRRALLTVTTTDNVSDPFLQKRDAQLRRLHAAMP